MKRAGRDVGQKKGGGWMSDACDAIGGKNRSHQQSPLLLCWGTRCHWGAPWWGAGGSGWAAGGGGGAAGKGCGPPTGCR